MAANSFTKARSISCSESTQDGIFEYKNHDFHSSNLMKSILDNWKNEKFCDIELVVGIEEKKVSAHKIILVSSCDYFKGLLKPDMLEGQQNLVKCFEGLKFTAVLTLIEYCYSGKIMFTGSSDIGIEHLLEAADYMRLQEVCQEIAVFIKAHMNVENCLGILQIAEHYLLESLHISAFNYAAYNYVAVVNAEEEFMAIPISVLEKLLCSERLVIQKDNIVLSVSKQEEFVADSVLKYVKQDIETRLPLLPGLMQNIKLPLLSKEQLRSLGNDKCIKNNPACLKIIDMAKKTKPMKVTDAEGELWARPRRCQGLLLRELCEYAGGGQVRPEISKFDCRDVLKTDNTIYLCGLKIGIRRWDGREVLGGLQVFYSNGQKFIYGMNPGMCETTKEFKLKANERIVKADVRSGWMIDKLVFYSNLGKMYGPYGGEGGSPQRELPPENSCPYLAGISGTVVKSQGSQGITRLKFLWGFYDFSEKQEMAEAIKNEKPKPKRSTFDGLTRLTNFGIVKPYPFIPK